MAGRTRRCYEQWRQDPEFRADVDHLRAWRTRLHELDPESTADMAQIEAWRREFDDPKPAPLAEQAPLAAPRSPLPTGTCHACGRNDLLLRGPRGDLRCIRCAASAQHVPIVSVTDGY